MTRKLRFRARQVLDGRWVGEERVGWWIFSSWKGIDTRCPQFLFTPDQSDYQDCLGSRDQVVKALSARGHSWPVTHIEETKQS